MPPLRGYYVYERHAEWGIPVAATSTREARHIGFASSEIDCAWVDLCCHWRRDANVCGLPVGIIEDATDALRRGLYQYLEGGTCDICGAEDAHLESVNGQAVCEACIENLEEKECEKSGATTIIET